MAKKKKTNWLVPVIILIVFFGLSLLALSFLIFAGGDDNFSFSQKIGVIPIKGEIATESFNSPISGLQVGSTDIVKLIEKADADPSVSVILLDINSGGGSVVASKEIEGAVKRAKKPIVSYISDVGASGAYYIASATDTIIADEDSITGSIGVVAMVPSYTGLMKKIGVNMTVLHSGKMKTISNPFTNLTSEEASILQEMMDSAFETFKTRVHTNRAGKISREKLDEIADGRIMSGRKAKELGLLDELGDKHYAIERAGQIGGIEGKPGIKTFKKSIAPLSEVFGEVGYEFGKGIMYAINQKQEVKLEA